MVAQSTVPEVNGDVGLFSFCERLVACVRARDQPGDEVGRREPDGRIGIPEQLYLGLHGGDTTVPGYGLRDIGVQEVDGSVTAGRYLAVATVLVLLSIMLLTVLEMLRRRNERLRGMSPG